MNASLFQKSIREALNGCDTLIEKILIFSYMMKIRYIYHGHIKEITHKFVTKV